MSEGMGEAQRIKRGGGRALQWHPAKKDCLGVLLEEAPPCRCLCFGFSFLQCRIL